MSWRWLTLASAGFRSYSAPCDVDGPVGSTRWPLSKLGFRGVRDSARRGSGELQEDSLSSTGRSMSPDGGLLAFARTGRREWARRFP